MMLGQGSFELVRVPTGLAWLAGCAGCIIWALGPAL